MQRKAKRDLGIGIDLLAIDLTALAVFSGAFGLAIGFGLQKTFGNLIAGIILLMDKSIKPGDVIAIDGRRIRARAGEAPKVLLYHKPEGEIVSHDDPAGRASVFDALPRLRSGNVLPDAERQVVKCLGSPLLGGRGCRLWWQRLAGGARV